MENIPDESMKARFFLRLIKDHAMKAYGSGGMAPYIRNLDSSRKLPMVGIKPRFLYCVANSLVTISRHLDPS
jgi:hypothetical protein